MKFLDIIETNKERYLEFNEIKFKRFQQLISNNNTRRVINSIPFLLSVNHKRLPGYIEDDVPLGIANYNVDEDTRRFIRAKFPAIKIEMYDGPPFIEMLAVMGSVGTIAYNKKSDFDYWACVNRCNISDEQFLRFKKKVEAVQEWASSEIRLPVHIFINDVEHIKQNVFAEDDEEALGSTVGAVLKDEFFRSSIIICGKIPFWWVIPRFVRDEEYYNFFARLPKEKSEKDFVDLGNLYEISREDFLGAALFQIIKSLGNPFKSIIKIGVLEKYISGISDSPLLSQKVKINMLRENYNNTILDAYLLMFQEVYDYYDSVMNDKALLDILKKNLYLKIDPQLSKYVGVKTQKNIPYKVAIMFQYIKEWGWGIKDITELDNFDNWDFNKVMEFWDSVKKFMLLSYQRISEKLPTLNLEKKISGSDFMLLSRKIKTHFKRGKDKIEQFITFKDTPCEAILYIEPISQGIHDVKWRLYKRNSSEKKSFVSTTLKTESDLLKLLIWAALNQIYDPIFSRLNIQSGYNRINQHQVMNLLNHISSYFTGDQIYVRNENFLKPTFILLHFVIINFNIEDAETIQSIHHLYHTSWGESYLKEYNSLDDLYRILYNVLNDGYKIRRSFDNYCAISCPDPYKKQYKMIINLFKEAYIKIVEDEKKESARFIAYIGEKYIIITRDEGVIQREVCPNYLNLLVSMTLKPKKNITYKFFGSDPTFEVLDKVYSLSMRYSFTIAYEEKGNFIFVYVVNEKGNLFSFLKPIKIKEDFLKYLYSFCQNITKRVSKMDVFSNINKGDISVQYLRVDRFGKISIIDKTQNIKGQCILKSKEERALIASVLKHKGDETLYNIIFPDNVSSGFIPFQNLGSLSKKIVDLNNSGEKVNIIISDLVLSDIKREEIEMGSTLYLLEKYRIESILEKAIKKH